MVVVPVSPPDSQSLICAVCGKTLADFLARQCCPACGNPQPVSPDADYFSLLGVPRAFAQDRAVLEKNFYAVSRVMHPDRFTTSSADARRWSMERMSLVNEAYRTLRGPASLREYVLRQEGVLTDSKPAQTIPSELAEDWFELQDFLFEGGADPAQCKARVEDFEKKLQSQKDACTASFTRIERRLDEEAGAGRAFPQSLLNELHQAMQTQSYLKSMERDVQRLKSRMNG